MDIGGSELVNAIVPTPAVPLSERCSLLAQPQDEPQVSNLFAVLAHEFRNPLSAIRNALDVARLSGGADAEWAIAVVDRQSSHLVRLVEDLLEASRLARGKARLDRRVLDVATVLDSAIETARPLICARRHQLETAYSRQLKIRADGARLQQIVINLLTNAAKYTPAGGDIRLLACRMGTEVIISVRDTGVGIPPERLSAMFEPFTQCGHTLHRSEGGLGLGLSIVRSLAEMHGGTVVAKSDGIGKGCEFTVKLPAGAEALE
jgi:signal transduction histidine kinase